MGNVSILAPASLRKATQNISPQTCKTHGSQQPRGFPPLPLGLVAVWGRDQNKGVEEECRAQREIPEPASFCLLPPTVPLWATRCAALESTMNKSQHDPALAELAGQREGVQSLPQGGHQARSNQLSESKG